MRLSYPAGFIAPADALLIAAAALEVTSEFPCSLRAGREGGQNPWGRGRFARVSRVKRRNLDAD
jgi:hypothetical protein